MSRILIVGDIPALSGKLGALYGLGHEIELVDSGQDALWHIEEPSSCVDVVVAAEHLADMDGFALICAIVRLGMPELAIVLAGNRHTPFVTVRTSRGAGPERGEPSPAPDPVAHILALAASDAD